jgi:hypothetical protein
MGFVGGIWPSTQIVSLNFCVNNFSWFQFFYFDGLLTYHHHHLVGGQSILVFLIFWRARETRRGKKKLYTFLMWLRPQQAQRKKKYKTGRSGRTTMASYA